MLIKKLFLIIFLIPSLSWGKSQFIYCYEVDLMDELLRADNIYYYKLSDKDKTLIQYKQYSDDFINDRFYFKGVSDGWDLDRYENPEIEVETIRFNDNHITIREDYTVYDYGEEKDIQVIKFTELDRDTGMMISYSSIYPDENGDMYTKGNYSDKTEDEKYFLKDDFKLFWNNSYKVKYMCEPSKQL